jgi:AraC-like DNA-binding protein
MKKIYAVFLLTILNFTHLIAQESPLRVDTCQLVTPLDFTPSVAFLKDNAFKINDLDNQTFELFTKEKAQSLQPDSTYWFRFTLKNNSPTTEFKALLFTDKQSITELFEPDRRVLKSGDRTIFSELSITNERMFLPISVFPNVQKTYFLRLTTLKKRPVTVFLQLTNDAYKSQEKLKWQFDNKGVIIFYAVFLLILLLVIVFSLIQGRLLRDKTYLFYALYLLALCLYYARSYEKAFDYPILSLRFPILYDLLEVYLNVISYLLYILFFREFLNLSNRLPKIDNILKGLFGVISALLFINILIQIFIGIKAGLWFYDRLRMIFFVFAVFYFYILVLFKGDRLTRLLGFGFFVVLLASVVSVYSSLTHSVLLDTFAGVWRHYQVIDFHYWFYDVQVGILIEIACFSTALYYKTKAERRRNLETRQRLDALSDEYESLKQQNEQAEKDRLTLAEKEAILQRQIALMKMEVIDNQENTSENAFILRGLKIIDNNLQNPDFSIEDFAKAMHLARGKFYADWKKATGQTPNESIQNARLSAIQRLLLTTDLTVAEIAHQTGFNEAAYLSRFFQQKMGQSPTDFRVKKG